MAVHTHILRNIFRSKLMALFVIVLLVLLIIPIKWLGHAPRDIHHDAEWIHTVRMLYVSLAGDNHFLFIYIPFYLLFSLQALHHLQPSYMMIRYSNLKKWIHVNVRLCCTYASLFTLLLQGLILLFILVRGCPLSSFVSLYLPFLFTTSIIQWISFVVIGVIGLTCAIVLHHLYWGLCVPMMLLFIMTVMKKISKSQWVTFAELISGTFKMNEGHLSLSLIDVIIIAGLALVVYLFFVLLYMLMRNQDICGN